MGGAVHGFRQPREVLVRAGLLFALSGYLASQALLFGQLAAGDPGMVTPYCEVAAPFRA